jgi:glycosyltransferase involved in cell wall biosynthesis
MACPTLVAGGAERQIVNTAIGLRNRIDADVSILVSRLFSPPGNDFFHDELVESGVDVREVQSPTSTAESWARHQASPSEQTLLKLRELLKRLPAELGQEVANLYLMLRELRPAVVHAWLDHSSVCAGLAALLAGVPRVLLSGRNVSPVHFAYILQPYMRPAYRAMAMRPEAVFVNNSQGGAADYADWLGLDIRRFNIIYNGLDLVRSKVPTPTQTTDLRRRHGIPDHAFLVGGMFRLSPEKRPLLWAETLSRIVTTRPHVYGLLFGAGTMKGELETYLKQSGAADRIFLSPPTKDSATALAAFDVLLLTSRWEGTPNVAIEAQAAGTPVVVSGGGGAAEALDHGRTGIFVPHSDADALAPAVISLIEDATLRQRLAAAGPTFVTTRFGLDRMLSETLRLYGIPASTKPHAPTRRGDPLAGSAIAERTRCE